MWTRSLPTTVLLSSLPTTSSPEDLRPPRRCVSASGGQAGSVAGSSGAIRWADVDQADPEPVGLSGDQPASRGSAQHQGRIQRVISRRRL